MLRGLVKSFCQCLGFQTKCRPDILKIQPRRFAWMEHPSLDYGSDKSRHVCDFGYGFAQCRIKVVFDPLGQIDLERRSEAFQS